MDLHATQRAFATVDVREIARAKDDVGEPKPWGEFGVDGNAAKFGFGDRDPIGTNVLQAVVFDERTVEHQFAALDRDLEPTLALPVWAVGTGLQLQPEVADRIDVSVELPDPNGSLA